MLPFIAPVIGLLGGLAKSWMKKKQVQAEGKIEIEKAKVKGKINQAAEIISIDKASSGDMRYSWKDEFFVLILSIPVVLCFIPGFDVHVLRGFAVLKETPEWYRYAFLGAIVASFGLRTWFNGFSGFGKK